MTRDEPAQWVVPTSILLLSAGAFWAVAWVYTFLHQPPEVWQRDWFCIWQTGAAWLDGQRTGLYTTDFSDARGYFWLYPPYALYPAAVLGLLPSRAAYILLMTTIPLAVAASLAMLRSSLPKGPDFVFVVALTFGSAAFNGVFVTGQNSAWWLLCTSAGLWALSRERPVLAGVALAGLGFKPNWVAYFVLWLLLTRRLRVLAVVAGVGVAMVASSLPMGLGPWLEFKVSSEGYGALVLASYEAVKLITVHSFWRTILDPASVAFTVLWLATEAALVAAWLAVCRWQSLPRQVGATVLLLLVSNVYTNFYDALLLAVPTAVWWTHRDSYGRGPSAVIAISLVVFGMWQWISMYALDQRDLSLLGVPMAVWLLAEGLDAYRAPLTNRSGSTARSAE